MRPGLLAGIAGWCWRHPWLVVTLSVLLSGGLGWYAAGNLGLDTDESKMIAADLPFRAAERRMDQAFPQNTDLLVVVLDGPTSELTETAIGQLQERLNQQSALFRNTRRPPEEMFFRQDGLLFLPAEALSALSDRLIAAQPLLGALARDPSLRGLLDSIDLALEGVKRGDIRMEDLRPLLDGLDSRARQVATHQPIAPFSWQKILSDNDRPRRVLLIQPVLHFGDLQAGGAASQAIRHAATDLGLTPDNGYRLRLTGPVALADANFATVAQGVEISAPLSLLAVCLLLFWALRSARMAGAILVSLVAGLTATAAFAAATVGKLNPISVAFAVMFVGIAVDFAIQFTMRFRDEHQRLGALEPALAACAAHMAAPLSLAAVATATGFLSFLPTDYVGVSQLGLIAGGGMLIALVVDFTLLPALLALVGPPPEHHPVGLPFARGEGWLSRHCVPVVLTGGWLALMGAGLLPLLPEDFNPLHLQNPKDEAVATFRDLAADPDSGAYAIDILTKNPQDLAQRLDALPVVRRTMTLASFIPDQQEEKLAIISDLSSLLGPTLNPTTVRSPPSAEELRELLRKAGQTLTGMGVANSLDDAAANPMALQEAMTAGLTAEFGSLRYMLSQHPITAADLPGELRGDWVAPDGQARVLVLPQGDMNDEDQLIAFVKAVRGIAPDATGMPVDVEQASAVVVKAFSRAALSALTVILILLGLMLRRLLDALLVVLPLVMGALYTVIVMVVIPIPINFANIVALPLLLGIGVAFNIYFVVNWRAGMTTHLQSATSRAVLSSALTTGSAFGSLAISPHLGTASMGLLLLVSLGLSVVTTFTVLPALFCLMDRRSK